MNSLVSDKYCNHHFQLIWLQKHYGCKMCKPCCNIFDLSFTKWYGSIRSLKESTSTYLMIDLYILCCLLRYFTAFIIQAFLRQQKIAKINQKSLKSWAVKIADVNLEHDGKMADHTGNSTSILKFVSRSFHIPECNLRPTSFPVVYFKLWEKWASFFRNNIIVVTYWFQYEWRAKNLLVKFNVDPIC